MICSDLAFICNMHVRHCQFNLEVMLQISHLGFDMEKLKQIKNLINYRQGLLGIRFRPGWSGQLVKVGERVFAVFPWAHSASERAGRRGYSSR